MEMWTPRCSFPRVRRLHNVDTCYKLDFGLRHLLGALVDHLSQIDQGVFCGETIKVVIRCINMERVMGFEPTLVSWEETVLPLNYTHKDPVSQ